MAIKYDEGKPDFTTIPQLALREVAKVATKGGVKYPPFNYSNEKSPRRYVAAGLRHINEYLLGEDIDEIGTHHLANAAMSIMMALDNILNKTVDDDRNIVYKNKLQLQDFDIHIIGINFVFFNGSYDININPDKWKLLNKTYKNFVIEKQVVNNLIIKPLNGYIPKVGDKLQ